MFKSREVVPRAVATVLAVAAAGYGAHKLELDDPIPSYKEQVSQQLGASGLEATGISVDSSSGTFTFVNHEGRYTETCNGRFSSENGIYITDYDPSIDCVSNNEGPTILPTQP